MNMLLDDSALMLWDKFGMEPFQFGGDRRSRSGDDLWSAPAYSSIDYSSKSFLGGSAKSTSGGDARLLTVGEAGAAYLRNMMNQESFARRIFGGTLDDPPAPPPTQRRELPTINQAWVQRLEQLQREDDE